MTWRDVLPVHPAAELFPRMSPEELRALGEDIKKNGLTSPIVLWEAEKNAPPLLLDGRNRLDAIEMALGPPEVSRWQVSAPALTGGLVTTLAGHIDPDAYVISANIHRRHLTAEQRRDLIAKLIKAEPSKSNRQIATTAKASPTTVGTVRAKMKAAGDVSKLDTSIDTKGRKQPTRKRAATAAVIEQRRQTRVAKQEQANARARARGEREESDISRFAYKLVRLDIEIARELQRVLVECGGDANQLMDDLAAGIEIEEVGKFNKGDPDGNDANPDATAEAVKAKFAAIDDGLDIPACLRRTP